MYSDDKSRLHREEVSNPELPSGQNINQAMEQLTKEIMQATDVGSSTLP
jgi:hypothetical protein